MLFPPATEARIACAITKYLPAFAGMQLLDELKHLQPVLINQKKPFVAIIGGAKIKDKIPVINVLRKKADAILVAVKLPMNILPQ